jgi:RNA polymerase sigma factor (sigma-70 family)
MIHVLRLLRAVAGSDRDLLTRYARDRDEEVFAALLRRYCHSVWAACVRLAGREAEDAFQVVFLTLSRRAGTVTGSLPAWLHAVTRRVAANFRRDARRRDAIEWAAARPDVALPADPSLREGLALLDEELARLPERYRAVVIVCCLEGRSRGETAAQLGWTEGQVKGRLERAREMLRTRLARRGVELGGVLLATTVCRPAPAVSSVLTGPSPAVLSLTDGVIHATTVQKLKVVVAVLVTVAVAAGGVLAYRSGGTEADRGERRENIAGGAAPREEQPPVKRKADRPPGDRWDKRRAAYEQIAKLHTVDLSRWFERGAIDLFPPPLGENSDLPTAVLFRMGVGALPRSPRRSTRPRQRQCRPPAPPGATSGRRGCGR